MNTKKLALPVLGMILAGNARAQNNTTNIHTPVADKITKNLYWGDKSGATVAQGSVRIMPNDGFISVEYILNYATPDGEIIQMPKHELYNKKGNVLDIVGAIVVAKEIKRIKIFPKKLEKHLSNYLVLCFQMAEYDGGYTLYNAFDMDGNLVGYSYSSLKDLKKNISTGGLNNNKLIKDKSHHR